MISFYNIHLKIKLLLKNMFIVGLTAKKGSGKDTLADYLVKKKKYIKLSFAQFIKEASKHMFMWDDINFTNENKEKIDTYWGISPRLFLQSFGTQFLRNIPELNSQTLQRFDGVNIHGNFTYHIKRLNLNINQIYKKNKFINIVITDIRFKDEYDFVKALGGIIIKINRSNIKINEYSNHVSETNIDNFKPDLYIQNDSTLQNFYYNIDKLF